MPGAQAAGLTSAVVQPPGTVPGAPRIDCGSGSGPETIRAVQDALNAGAVPGTYVTDGKVVILEEVSGSPDAVTPEGSRPLPVAVSEATAPALASLLARHTFTIRRASGGKGRRAEAAEFTPAAGHLSAALAPRSWPGLLPLNGVTGSPVLRPDGTLLTAPGYDRATGALPGQPGAAPADTGAARPG